MYMKTCVLCGDELGLYSKKYCNSKKCRNKLKQLYRSKFKTSRLRVDSNFTEPVLLEWNRRYMESQEHYDMVKGMLYSGTKLDTLIDIFGEDVKQWLAPLPRPVKYFKQKTA